MGFKEMFSEKKWHFTPTESYGGLGWIQTFCRLLAIGVALLSWIQFIIDGERSKSELRELTVPRIAEITFLCAIALMHIWKFFLIVISGEAFAFGLHSLLFLADGVMILDLIFQFDPSTFIFLYALCNTMGEVLQLLFLMMRSREHLDEQLGVGVLVLVSYSAVVGFLYIVLLIAQAVIFSSTYQKFHGY